MSNISWMSDSLRKKAHFFTVHEAAWDISDIDEIIKEATSNKKVILGGDILNTDMEYTYDNWYYSPDRAKDKEYNVRQSCNHTLMYLSDYMREHGKKFCIVVVFE